MHQGVSQGYAGAYGLHKSQHHRKVAGVLGNFFRPSSPSLASFSNLGMTTVKSCMMMDALIYGVILMANMENLLKEPPEITSKNPNKALLFTRSAKTWLLTPGTGMCAPSLKTNIIPRVNKILRLSSSIFKAFF
jgi:hypothetical protein